jgi:hypothetical protein
MCHVRKLQLWGNVCGRTQRVQTYYSWPEGEKQSKVEELIAKFKKAFCNVTVQIQHNYLDD